MAAATLTQPTEQHTVDVDGNVAMVKDDRKPRFALDVLLDVSRADDDIYEDIVNDAVSFSDKVLRGAAKVLQPGFQLTNTSEEEDEQGSLKVIMKMQEDVCKLQVCLSMQTNNGGVVDEDSKKLLGKTVPVLAKNSRTKVSKKLRHARSILDAIIMSMLMRAMHKRNVMLAK
eukprot:TRINITY_DN22607_c0_g2_i1.p1 TRINITY_DN22607_c0_g2~~TRINITY_DN22607_c0_g2_i1.p1  ORF type:complete len:172 (-),score=44.72 TRINITY_DN22607_c0_g2_i1:440-955(-)